VPGILDRHPAHAALAQHAAHQADALSRSIAEHHAIGSRDGRTRAIQVRGQRLAGRLSAARIRVIERRIRHR
jgi:hypothetical protein